MQDAYSYAQTTEEKGKGYHVMISPERSVRALRDLADRIERGEVALDKVRVFTFADSEEYTKTALKLVFTEKRDPAMAARSGPKIAHTTHISVHDPREFRSALEDHGDVIAKIVQRHVLAGR